ncbi:MAG: NAD-dependent epimerase/dehydratase family protein [Candidatus Omnitrophota bacterium]
MNVLVTGAGGFIGKNLCLQLRTQGHAVLEFLPGQGLDELEKGIGSTDFIVHLAGVTRPENPAEFYDRNVKATAHILEICRRLKRRSPIIFSSSIQAVLDNDYGKSKKAAEDILFAYSNETGTPVFIYRLHNVFGKWGRPDYNSVVATFCHQVSRGREIHISDTDHEITLTYIDDVVNEFLDVIAGRIISETKRILSIRPIYPLTLGELAEILYSFYESRNTLRLDLSSPIRKRLYSVYSSYIDPHQFDYKLPSIADPRGLFSEFLKHSSGQVSISFTHPGAIKGNHYHDSKFEKFLVVSGEALIKFRHVHGSEVYPYKVLGEDLRVIDVVPGYVHSIQNTGKQNLITVIWAGSVFDPEKPDTHYVKVESHEKT